MNDFIRFLEDQGVSDAGKLLDCVNQITKDPEGFYRLSSKKRAALEKRIDRALLAIEATILT